ncbi:protein Aatf [Bradysia coprophila]|uniref:protein Aatf n=1 Tax=Bradysia coprophila TaxID=38358 RepID=UPI00187DBC81|nr:protein Aatf [Bradysia coprophila]
MNRKKVPSVSIGDKINELLAPKQLHDPEYNSEDETVAKTRYYDSEEEEDNQPVAELSHIRKKNVRLLQDIDAKYSGKISSRNELDVSSEYEESSDSEPETGDFAIKLKELDSDDGENVDTDTDDDGKGSKSIESNSGDEVDEAFGEGGDDETEDEESEHSDQDDDDDDDGSSSEGSESDFDGGDIIPRDQNGTNHESDGEVEEKEDENQTKISKDVEKGVSVQNQLHIWEKLLEIRIHSQKMLLKANGLPQANSFQQLQSNTEFNEAVEKTSANVDKLLTKLCTLQKALINQYPETKEIAGKRQRTDDGDEPDRISKIGKKLQHDFADFKDYRNATISKWYDRTKVLTPGASKTLKQPTFDIIRNIEGVLSNRDELIKKTQTYKGGYEIIGMDTTIKDKLNAGTGEANGETEPMICSEIYDDTDFYHSQLRELIEFKTNASTNPADVTKQFAELQKLRNKIKKVVDTRASKGRKIRYAVHNKMVNFMARNDPTEWSNEAKTELFSSLFSSRTG